MNDFTSLRRTGISEWAEQRMSLAIRSSVTVTVFDIAISLPLGIAAAVGSGSIGLLTSILGIGLVSGSLSVGFILGAAIVSVNRKMDAEADESIQLIKAQREAITLAIASGTSQLNLNAGPGSMTVKNKPISIKHINGNVTTLELNQTNQIDQRRIEIPAADVRWFVEQLPHYGHSKSKWVSKVELPYSRQMVDWTIYKVLLDALTSSGKIVGRGERASGRLIEGDPGELVKAIEQTYPGAGSKGITIELPAQTST